MTENEKQFINELEKISVKYKIKICGCGCCGSPYLSELEPEEITSTSGYTVDKYLEMLKWVSGK